MLPTGAVQILDRFRQHGLEAFAVGGCVRDMLRGVAPSDIDITTNASPEETMRIFYDHHVIPTGLQHGTVTVMVDHCPYEITTYRTDGTYTDGRHPDSVQFTASLEEDLKRRDFTINAMAYHPDKGVVDPFGGQADLQRRILRCVGDADTRFTEDALRIARLLRFMSALDMDAADDTAAAAHRLYMRLDAVAAERKRVELEKMLMGDGFLKAALQFSDVLCHIVPSLKPLCGFDQRNPHHAFDVYTHTVRAVYFAERDPIVKLAMLFHDVGKPATFTADDQGIGHFYDHAAHSEVIAAAAMKDLRFDNTTMRHVLPLVRHHGLQLNTDRRFVNRWLSKLGEETFRRLLSVKTADVLSQKEGNPPPDFSDILALIDDVIAQNACLSLSSLAISGNDLLSVGYPAGPLIGTILNTLFEDVLSEILPNDRETLLQSVKERWPLV